jgi:WD40 repeat protein
MEKPLPEDDEQLHQAHRQGVQKRVEVLKWANLAAYIVPVLLLAGIGLWLCPPSRSLPMATRVFCALPRPRYSSAQGQFGGRILVMRADTGKVFDDIQSLVPEPFLPLSGTSASLVVCVYPQSGEWSDGSGRYTNYRVRITTWPGRGAIGEITLEGEQPSKTGNGNPPADLAVVLWLAKTLGFDMAGVLPAGGFGPLAFSSDGKLLVTAGSGNDVILWEVDTQKPLRTLTGLAESPRAAFFTDDGQLLTVDIQGGVIGWDTTNGTQLRQIQAPQPETDEQLVPCFYLNDVALYPNGRVAASAWNCLGKLKSSPLVMWDTMTGQPVSSPNMPGGISFLPRSVNNVPLIITSMDTVAFSPNGSFLAAVSGNGIFLIDLASQQIKTHMGEQSNAIAAVFSPDSLSLAILSGSKSGNFPSVCIFNIQDGETSTCFNAPMHVAEKVTFSPDGRLLAVSGGCQNEMVAIWNLQTGELVDRLRGHMAWTEGKYAHCAIFNIAFSPDGSLLATSGGDGNVLLWDVESGALAEPQR